MWLKEDYSGGLTFFPDDGNNSFDFPATGDDLPTSLVVEGLPVPLDPEQGPSGSRDPVDLQSLATVVRPETTAAGGNNFVPHSKHGSPSCNVKVVRADLRWLAGGKPEFTLSEQLYVCLTEATANVDYVLHTVLCMFS